MRVWDIPPELLCRNHLLGEHREIHAIWSIIVNGKSGYSRHPETMRWIGKLGALKVRHEQLVIEMRKRGYSHHSPLEMGTSCPGKSVQDSFVDSPEVQRELLGKKGCGCKV